MPPDHTESDQIALVRCYSGALVEEEWLAQLLAPARVAWRNDPQFEVVRPGAIYVVSGTRGLPAFPERFLDAIAAQGDCGLCHLGDEFFRADYRPYAAFAFVLRNFRASWLNAPGVLTLPLGYPPGCASATEAKRASARDYLWCFLGARNAARADLVRAWSHVPRALVSLPNARTGDALLPRRQYLDVMRNAAFAPAPMGNVVIETWRFWEALEVGAIPVAPRRRGLDYYTELLGPHPVPTFRTWDEAATFVARFERDRTGLDALQAEVLSWWAAEKDRWSARLADHVAQGRAGAFQSDLQARFEPFSRLRNQPRRIREFLRHHDAVALRGRAAIMLGRARAKVMGASRTRRATHPLTGEQQG